MGRAAAIAVSLVVAAAASAQRVDSPTKETAATVLARQYPVTAGDIVDRPYRVIARVDVYVQKLIWQPIPNEAKVYRELWERAERLGAHAVVNATYGSPQREFARSLGGRQASGEAITFLTADELSARRKP